MFLFLGIDAVATPRGDGLRPELRALLIRHAQASAGDATWNGGTMPTDSIPTDAPAETEPHRIPVVGL